MNVQWIPFRDVAADITVNEWFNVSNCWSMTGSSRPADYDVVRDACITSNMLSFMRPGPLEVVEATGLGAAWVCAASDLCEASGTQALSPLYADDLDALVAQNAHVQAALDRAGPAGVFVRTESVSCKYGVHGAGPYRTARALFESVLTARQTHAPLADVDATRGTLRLFLFPWLDDLKPDTEFRVFVYRGVVTAVSQQHWCTPNVTMTPMLPEERKAVLWKVVDACTAAAQLFGRHLTRAMSLLDIVSAPPTHPCRGSVVMDAAVRADGTVYVIEVNPFGGTYSSGSALFHWIRDMETLHSNGTEVVVRLVPNVSPNIELAITRGGK
jgi:hypothetical protein